MLTHLIRQRFAFSVVRELAVELRRKLDHVWGGAGNMGPPPPPPPPGERVRWWYANFAQGRPQFGRSAHYFNHQRGRGGV